MNEGGCVVLPSKYKSWCFDVGSGASRGHLWSVKQFQPCLIRKSWIAPTRIRLNEGEGHFVPSRYPPIQVEREPQGVVPMWVLTFSLSLIKWSTITRSFNLLYSEWRGPNGHCFHWQMLADLAQWSDVERLGGSDARWQLHAPLESSREFNGLRCNYYCRFQPIKRDFLAVYPPGSNKILNGCYRTVNIFLLRNPWAHALSIIQRQSKGRLPCPTIDFLSNVVAPLTLSGTIWWNSANRFSLVPCHVAYEDWGTFKVT